MKNNKYIKEMTVEVVENCGWGLPGTIVKLWRENDRLVGLNRWKQKQVFDLSIYVDNEDGTLAIDHNIPTYCNIISMIKQTKQQYALERLM